MAFGKVGEYDDRYLRELQLPGGQHASVPGDDATFRIDEHWVIETELGDAGGDLPDLDSGMGARIAHVRQKLIDLPEFDVWSGRWSLHGNTFLNGNRVLPRWTASKYRRQVCGEIRDGSSC